MEGCGSGLFCAYKSLGLVTDDVPLVLRRMPRKKLTVAFTAVGRSVHQYNAASLRLISVSDPLPRPITALAADPLRVFAAAGPHIAALHMGRQTELRLGTDDPASPAVRLLLPFGPHLLAVDDESRLQIWTIATQELHAELAPESGFTISALAHPPTYLNKVILGSKQGGLRLLNVRTSRVVYAFAGWDAAVAALEPSPAVDVVAVGLGDGRIHLHNLRSDETLFSFRQDFGPVSSLAFRTDGPAVLVSAGGKGCLAVWDLDGQKLVGQMTGLHREKRICRAAFVLGEPLLVTNGEDNGLRNWSFDLETGLGRQLAEREGHAGPVNAVRFHGSSGELLVSGADDGTLRQLSVWKDTKQKSLGTAGALSRAKAKKKGIQPETIAYPAVVELRTSTAREASWDNVVCRHRDSPLTSAWSSRKEKLGAHSFLHNRFASTAELRSTTATALELSACGNFVFLGYSSGHLDQYNLQSGAYRGSFKELGEVESVKHRAHMGSVEGLASDSVNVRLVSAGSEGVLKLWSVKKRKLESRLELKVPLVCVALQRDSELCAVGGAEGTLLVLDLHSKRVARKLSGPEDEAAGWAQLVFSPNSRWLLALSAQGHVKVFDLPNSSLIEYLAFDSPCVSLDLSPTSELLATAHKGRRGLYLWTNKSVYAPQYAMKALPRDFRPTGLSLPLSAPIGVAEEGEEEAADGAVVDMETEDAELIDPPPEEDEAAQLAPDLVTLSGLPAHRWAQVEVLSLDAMREAAKPKAPPKKPEAAPFFLPTTSGLRDFTFQLPDESEEAAAAGEKSRFLQRKVGSLRPLTALGRALEAGAAVEAWALLKVMSAGQLDREIRQLGPDAGGSEELMRAFLSALGGQLEARRDFELCQAWLALFLKLHRDTVWDAACPEGLRQALGRVGRLSDEASRALDDDADFCLATLAFLKSATL